MIARPRLLLAALLASLLPSAGAAADPATEGGRRIVLRWQPVGGAAAYDLQVAADPSFAAPWIAVRVQSAGYRLGPPPEVRAFWRVRTVDGEGRPGPWSRIRTVEPLLRAAEPAAAPAPAPPAAPPLPPAPIAAPALAERTASARPSLEPSGAPTGDALARLPDPGFEGFHVGDLLREGRPGLLLGWRSNLLGVDAPAVAAEGHWRVPWFGAAWTAALRAGWWRTRAVVQVVDGAIGEVTATADVLPLRLLLWRAFEAPWVRLYAGAGVGADLVVVRAQERGALEASPSLDAVAGAGRRAGPGEAFLELGGGLGGVSGPLGRLRTGGISLAVGYRLER